jgi:YebC/PmpR family DNA-binding regulatory protein
MSGHSHWAGIKYKKQLADAQRSRAFSKVTREITIAAREGKDPETNPRLRVAIEKARLINLPSENIKRAIERGTVKIAGGGLEEVLFEAYGPGGIALLIEGITDNKNRAVSEVRQILERHDGKLVGGGAVRWMFERKGCIAVDVKKQEKLKSKEEWELTAIESGAEDIYWHDEILDVYTKPEELEKVKRNLTEKGVKLDSVSLDWVAKEEVSLDKKGEETCKKLFEALDESDSVQEIYSNLKV